MKTKYQTKFHKLKSRTKIPYPVGARMTQTMEKVKDMADKLKKIFPADSLPLNGNGKNNKPLLTFCVRGSSGAILAGLITPFLSDYEVSINYVKKFNEKTHGSGSVKMFLPDGYPWIIIDDFIESGETVNNIYAAMQVSRSDAKVDCLIVSGEVHQPDLDFTPYHVIAGNYFRTI